MPTRDPLNFFSPYERLPPGHENQLTRALLLVLRLSPMAHAEWLRRIEPDAPGDGRSALHELPPASFDTQRRVIRPVHEQEEASPLISVFLAPERPPASDGTVVASDRRQILDAVIDYGGQLLVVVENKVFEAADLQARHVNIGGARIQLVDGQQVVVVLWRDLLEAFTGLLDRRLVGGAEAQVVDDFLTYVEDHFPELGPYRTLALCAGVPSRMARRLRQLLGEATEREATMSAHGPRVAVDAGGGAGRDAYLRVGQNDDIELALYPADTLSQARSFYSRPTAVRGVLDLAGDEGWRVTPNFHFGHMQRGYCWTRSTAPLEAYVALWVDEVRAGSAKSVPCDGWERYWQWLIERGLAEPSDHATFVRDFVSTNRQAATPRPGLALERVWSREDAEKLDSRGALLPAIASAVAQAVSAVGAP